jgi:hypothetical protein
VHTNGEESCSLGFFVGVINDYELGNWVVRREIRPNYGKSVLLMDS